VHANDECVPKGLNKDANYMGNYHKRNPYSNKYNLGWAQHPNLKYSNNNTLNPLLPNLQPQQQQKPLAFEEAMTSFVKMTQTNFQEINASQEVVQINNEASMKNLENQIGQLGKQVANQSSGGFSGNTQDNPKNESCKVIV